MDRWLVLVILLALSAGDIGSQALTVDDDDQSFSRFRDTQEASCSSREFRCRNGQCISSELLCDGAVNCVDSSDETVSECDRPELPPCGPRTFRCNYGACIDGDGRCNSIVDCADGSDEAGCAKKTNPAGLGRPADCNINEQFRCDNGQCIPRTQSCDGVVNCKDRSDESYQNCRDFDCPAYAFQCRYGGCIDRNKKCNNEINCADGSDEDLEMCGRRPAGGGNDSNANTFNGNGGGRPSNNNNNNNGHTSRPNFDDDNQVFTPKPPTPVQPSRRNCPVPQQPENGEWLLDKTLCGNTNRTCRPQPYLRELEPGSAIVYNCYSGFNLNLDARAHCQINGKWSHIPKCEEVRCPSLTSAAIQTECTLNRNFHVCDSPVPVNTFVSLRCRNSYTQDITDLTRKSVVRCNSKGQWEPKPIKCVSVCGVAATGSGTPLIVNGTHADVAEFPWHATLYREKNGEKQFICGSTIIRDNLLVTAAHCVYDEVRKDLDDPSKYYVAAGNVFRDFDSELHSSNVVKAKVVEMYKACNYLGLAGVYGGDIAILKIDKSFTFSALIMPVCLDVSATGEQSLYAYAKGKVAGFGRTSVGESSFYLQTITVPYIPPAICKNSAGDSARFITLDKFCAGYHNGTSVCDGDSGGGLVFESDHKWYLRGIVSVGIGTSSLGAVRTCNSYAYSLYTSVASHMGWIQDVILSVETNRPVKECSLD